MSCNNVIKAMKIAKRNKKAKDLYDRKTRGYTDDQMAYMTKLVPDNYISQYLAAEDEQILKGGKE